MTDKAGQDVAQLDAELAEMFGDMEDEIGVPPAAVTREIIAHRRGLLQGQFAALRVDLGVAKALGDKERMERIHAAGREVMVALGALRDMEVALPSDGEGG